MTKYLRDYPLLLKEWDYEKNKNLDISKITSGMEKFVWWKCSKCGNEWESMIYSRFNGHGCPKCGVQMRANNRKKQNIIKNGSFADNHKELLKEWNYNKNNIKPEECSSNDNTKVWWKCSNGHEWEMKISKRTLRHQSCPYCSNQRILEGYNDLFTQNKDLSKEWDYKKNKIKPTKIGAKSSKKVWWKCSKCKHQWEATVASRNNGNGCPVCANKVIIKGYNDFATVNERIMPFWNYRKNKINPEQIAPGYSKKLWWKCPKCENEWYGVTPRGKNTNTICPNCSMELRISFSEKSVLFYIKKITSNVIENYRPSFLKGKEIDIYLPDYSIGIEYDGAFYHKRTERDLKKDELCYKNNITLYRIREYGCPILKSTSNSIIRDNDKEESLNNAIKKLIKSVFKKDIEVDIEKDNNGINDLILFMEKEKSLLNEYPSIAQEWNYEKNGNLRPEYVLSSSSKKVWWKCNVCNYEWKSIIYSRTRGNGCPVCSNRIIIKGKNDLETLYPELSKEWNYEKNVIHPDSTGAGSSKKVWWICNKGHEWMAAINSRVNGNGCPVCGKEKLSKTKTEKYIKKVGTFEDKHKELLNEWDYELNDKNPSEYPASSQQKVWWKCNEGHSYQNTIYNKIKGANCPYCSNKKLLKGFNDFETTQKELLKDWDYSKNSILPSSITFISTKNVWWKCSKCGNEWRTNICNRTILGRNCPKCGISKQKETYRKNIVSKRQPITITHPYLMNEWNYKRNEIDPSTLTRGSKTRAWWKCSKCGYEWETRINHRTAGSGCPKCYLNNKKLK